MPSHTTPMARRANARRQRGVYAVEWAIVFVAFFMLLYAIVSFGLAYLVRESMQWAVEDAVRAALQQNPNASAATARVLSKQQALAKMKSNLAWLPNDLLSKASDSANASFKICHLNDSNTCTEDMTKTALNCNNQGKPGCMFMLQLSLPYAKHSLTPSLSMGLMELAMPDLQAKAQIIVDQADI